MHRIIVNQTLKYPIGVQDFEKLRREGFFYVDKTRYVHKLVTSGSYYFLSRPRRFGKSLLLSTFKAYFEGKRELFDGLAIAGLEKEWAAYPVLHLDLNTKNYKERADLVKRLEAQLEEWEDTYGGTPGRDIELRFESVIKCARKHTGCPVVILIDEYDKPLLQAIDNEELQDEYRSILKAFYSNLKSQDGNIKFAFLTGVTKFGKVSVFSDLNNLNDISGWGLMSGVCGITETELHQYFDPSIRELAWAYGVGHEEMSARLKAQYDGYRFSQAESEGIYNPFSLLNTFLKMEMSDYWYQTATPTFLVKLLGQSGYDLRRLQAEAVTGDVLGSVDSMRHNPVPVLFQSGYLTIKSYDAEFNSYYLGFPNREVEQGFVNNLLAGYYVPESENEAKSIIGHFIRDLRAGDAGRFMTRLQTFFEDADYRVAGKMEIYFQNAMYIIFSLLGFYVQVERATARGRVDVTLQTPDYVYLMELKLDGTAAEAMRQIEEKAYAAPFAMEPRRLCKIGISFSSATRGVAEWLIQWQEQAPRRRAAEKK